MLLAGCQANVSMNDTAGLGRFVSRAAVCVPAPAIADYP
jgi:hypothetical protein